MLRTLSPAEFHSFCRKKTPRFDRCSCACSLTFGASSAGGRSPLSLSFSSSSRFFLSLCAFAICSISSPCLPIPPLEKPFLGIGRGTDRIGSDWIGLGRIGSGRWRSDQQTRYQTAGGAAPTLEERLKRGITTWFMAGATTSSRESTLV